MFTPGSPGGAYAPVSDARSSTRRPASRLSRLPAVPQLTLTVQVPAGIFFAMLQLQETRPDFGRVGLRFGVGYTPVAFWTAIEQSCAGETEAVTVALAPGETGDVTEIR